MSDENFRTDTPPPLFAPRSRKRNVRRNSRRAFYAMGHRINARERMILDCVKAHGAMTDRQVMRRLGFTEPNQVRPRITHLIELGIFREAGDVTCGETGMQVRTVDLTLAAKESVNA